MSNITTNTNDLDRTAATIKAEQPIERDSLEVLTEIHQRTTPGSWFHQESTDSDIGGSESTVAAVLTDAGPITWDDHGGDVFGNPADAEFIALAHEILPALLAEVQELRARLNQAQ